MADEVIEAALDWAVNDFARDCPRLHVTTGITGEGLHRIDAYERIRRRAEELQAETGKHITCAIGNTNLTLAAYQGRWALLTSPASHVSSISIDGPRHIHDAMRVFPDGRGTYDTIAPSIAGLVARGAQLSAQAVITGQYPNVTEVFLHLCELGFRAIELRPVRAPHDQPFAISPRTVDAVKQGFSEFADFLFSQEDRLLLAYLAKIWHIEDCLGRFLVRVASGHQVNYRCPAGKDGVCVDTDGGVYPCPGMVGVPELRMGSIYRGIDEGAYRLYYEDLLVTSKSVCKDCAIRHLCGGGCYHAAFLANGRVDTPDPCDCELTRHLVELAAGMVARLREERPAVFAAIRHPLGGRVHPSSQLLCIATKGPLSLDGPAAEWRSRAPLRFNRAEQLKWMIWGGPSEISGEIHMRWDSRQLYVMAELAGCLVARHLAGRLLEIYLVSLRDLSDGLIPEWWKLFANYHLLAYTPAEPAAAVRTGGGAVARDQVGVRVATRVEHQGEAMRVRMIIPWSALPLLDVRRDEYLAVNAFIYPFGGHSEEGAMVWLPGQPFGMLRLER